MRIYLDVCCLNRPFDDQSQERIRLEAEAVLLIMQRIHSHEWQFIGSEMVIDEIEQTPDLQRRERLRHLLLYVAETVQVDAPIQERARDLIEAGITAADALHIACAEKHGVDIFLTTDDRLLRRVADVQPPVQCRVDNPLNWLLEQKK